MKAIFITDYGNVKMTEEKEIDAPHSVYVYPVRTRLNFASVAGAMPDPFSVSETLLTYKRQEAMDANGRVVYICNVVPPKTI